MDAERLVGVERGAGGARIFRDQLEIAEGGDQRDDERHQERQPDHAADLLRDLPGQRVDAGAEDVADDEEQQQPGPHDPLEARLGRGGLMAAAADRYICHRIALPRSG